MKYEVSVTKYPELDEKKGKGKTWVVEAPDKFQAGIWLEKQLAALGLDPAGGKHHVEVFMPELKEPANEV